MKRHVCIGTFGPGVTGGPKIQLYSCVSFSLVDGRQVSGPARGAVSAKSKTQVGVTCVCFCTVYLGPRTACLCVQCGQCDLYLHSVLRTRRIMVVRSILSMRMPMRTETHKQPHRTSSSLNPLCPLLRSHMYLATSKPSLRVS